MLLIVKKLTTFKNAKLFVRIISEWYWPRFCISR